MSLSRSSRAPRTLRCRSSRARRSARSDADKQRWFAAAKALGSLSQGAQLRAESRALATSVYPPLVRQRLADSDWSGAADTLLAARRLGVPRTELEPLTSSIRASALDLVAAADRADDAGKRMQMRLAAEETFMSWERATDQWGTPPLIALRAAMARDLAAAERQERRRGTP